METRTAIDAGGAATLVVEGARAPFSKRFRDPLRQYGLSLGRERLGYGALVGWALTGSLAFHAAYAQPEFGFLVHWLAPVCVALTAICGCGLIGVSLWARGRKRR